MPIQNVIELVSKLTLDTDTINTWKNGIARALKRYVKDGTVVEGEKCPQCGDAVIYTGGCKQCASCGWSKCS
jgi:ribonucleoside-diphosphate reductase alpha chain